MWPGEVEGRARRRRRGSKNNKQQKTEKNLKINFQREKFCLIFSLI